MPSRFLPAILAMLLLASPSRADVQLSLDIGWQNAARADAVNPVYITVWDPALATSILPREIVIEITSPYEHDRSSGVRFAQHLAITGSPHTIMVYSHADGGYERDVVTARDAHTGRRLAETTFSSTPAVWVHDTDLLIGIAGEGSAITEIATVGSHFVDPITGEDATGQPAIAIPNGLSSQTVTPSIRLGRLPPAQLPDTLRGYESLSILFLNAADLSTLPDPVQQAIARWVRAGGSLMFWPGSGNLPPSSPIVQLIGGSFGQLTALPISLEESKHLGILPRFDKIAARLFTPPDGARISKLPVLGGDGGKAQAISYDAGLGRMLILPANLGALMFNEKTDATALWMPLVTALQPSAAGVIVPKPSGYPYGYGVNMANQQLAQRLGNIPGVGKFDFSMVALIVVGLALVVGPVDWFLLKRAKRQPWTWVTTAGWIGLVSAGAVYAGELIHSGDLHYRTQRIVEQVGERVVADQHIVGIYSPRTQMYGFDGPENWWWEPFSITNDYDYYRRSRSGGGITNALDMDQDSQGQRPHLQHTADGAARGTMSVAVWNLAFLQASAEQPETAKPLISASLKLERGPDGKAVLRGSVKNLSDSPLVNIFAMTANEAFLLTAPQSMDSSNEGEMSRPMIASTSSIKLPQELAGGAFLAIDAPANSNMQAALRVLSGSSSSSDGIMQSPGVSVSFPEFQPFLRQMQSQATARTSRVAAILHEHDDRIVIYAEGYSGPSAAKLVHPENSSPKELHWVMVRAIFPLE